MQEAPQRPQWKAVISGDNRIGGTDSRRITGDIRTLTADCYIDASPPLGARGKKDRDSQPVPPAGMNGRGLQGGLMTRSSRVLYTDMQGYALVEFAMKSEAEAAIKGTDKTTFLEQEIRT